MASAESYVQKAQQIVCRVFPEGKIAIQWNSRAEARAQKRVTDPASERTPTSKENGRRR